MGWGTPLERFQSKITVDAEGCWVWTGGRKAAGYGQFAVDGKKVIVHRWAYGHFVGPIPEGHEIDHLCANRSCANPEHLEAVTLQVNRERRNARKTHCINGHEFTPENTTTWTDREGYASRRCVTCHRETLRRFYERRAART